MGGRLDVSGPPPRQTNGSCIRKKYILRIQLLPGPPPRQTSAPRAAYKPDADPPTSPPRSAPGPRVRTASSRAPSPPQSVHSHGSVVAKGVYEPGAATPRSPHAALNPKSSSSSEQRPSSLVVFRDLPSLGAPPRAPPASSALSSPGTPRSPRSSLASPGAKHVQFAQPADHKKAPPAGPPQLRPPPSGRAGPPGAPGAGSEARGREGSASPRRTRRSKGSKGSKGSRGSKGCLAFLSQVPLARPARRDTRPSAPPPARPKPNGAKRAERLKRSSPRQGVVPKALPRAPAGAAGSETFRPGAPLPGALRRAASPEPYAWSPRPARARAAPLGAPPTPRGTASTDAMGLQVPNGPRPAPLAAPPLRPRAPLRSRPSPPA